MHTDIIACNGQNSFELQNLKELTAVLPIALLQVIDGTLQYGHSSTGCWPRYKLCMVR